MCCFSSWEPSSFCFCCLQEALGRDTVSDCVLSFTEMLLPVLLGLLSSIDPAHGDARLRKQCRRIARVSGLLLDILSLSSKCCFHVRERAFQSLNAFTSVCCGRHKIFSIPAGERTALPLTGWIAALLLS